MATFVEKLEAAVARNDSLVCVGLDIDPQRVTAVVRGSPDWLGHFNAGIVEATADLACCYKPKLGFYEALGTEGWEGLQQTLRTIPRDVPSLLDAKRGDIDSTARAYARALF